MASQYSGEENSEYDLSMSRGSHNIRRQVTKDALFGHFRSEDALDFEGDEIEQLMRGAAGELYFYLEGEQRRNFKDPEIREESGRIQFMSMETEDEFIEYRMVYRPPSRGIIRTQPARLEATVTFYPENELKQVELLQEEVDRVDDILAGYFPEQRYSGI